MEIPGGTITLLVVLGAALLVLWFLGQVAGVPIMLFIRHLLVRNIVEGPKLKKGVIKVDKRLYVMESKPFRLDFAGLSSNFKASQAWADVAPAYPVYYSGKHPDELGMPENDGRVKIITSGTLDIAKKNPMDPRICSLRVDPSYLTELDSTLE